VHEQTAAAAAGTSIGAANKHVFIQIPGSKVADVVLIEGAYRLYALLPNKGRFVGIAIATAGGGGGGGGGTGPMPTVQLGRASIGATAVHRPTTSSRTADGGRR